MAWIAVDAGTSVIKAVTFADSGRELGLSRSKAAVLHPSPDWSEQKMEEVWSAVVATVRQAALGCQEPIRGIVSTAQGDGCWLVDQKGRPAGNAILWNDGRAAHMVESWRRAGLVGQSASISGSVTYPGLPNAILAWLERHQPERVAQARWALTCNGWLHAQMTGRFVADLSDASNPFSDIRARQYSPGILEIYGRSAAPLLPPIVAGTTAIAELQQAAAEELGLPAGLPVVMAPYDIVCTAYGAGAAAPGQGCIILGTTLCAETISASIDLSSAPSGTSIALHDGLYLRAMPTLTGCEAFDWASQLLQLEDVSALEALATRAAPETAAPLFLPYLSPAGERSPFLAAEARGSFHGLTFASGPAEIAFSVYEGLTHAIRECLRTAHPERLHEVRVCGGGAQSDFWCGRIANQLGIPVVRAQDAEIGARGAHLFALAVTGEQPSIAAGADKFVLRADVFEPSSQNREVEDSRFAAFLRVREAAREQWRAMAGFA